MKNPLDLEVSLFETDSILVDNCFKVSAQVLTFNSDQSNKNTTSLQRSIKLAYICFKPSDCVYIRLEAQNKRGAQNVLYKEDHR